MMKFRFILGLFGLLTLAACGGDDPVDPEPEPTPTPDNSGDNSGSDQKGEDNSSTDTQKPSTGRTVLVYIAAENSLTGFANTDISELKKGITSIDVDRHNLLVYVDNTTEPQLLHITLDKNGDSVTEVVKQYDEMDSTLPETMDQVFDDAFGAYPAQHYGLVLWSHGEGWIPKIKQTSGNWWGLDNNQNSTANTGSFMDISELAQALSQTVHFDYILFDACFMQSAEVIYDLKDYADYFIGSPAEIPGPGSPYDIITPDLFSLNEDCAIEIARAYFEDYEALYDPTVSTTNLNWTGGVCIGVAKSDAFEALATATAQVLPQYISAESAPTYASVMCYDGTRSNKYYHDFKDFIYQQIGEDNAVYQEWLKAFDEAVVYWGTTPTLYSEWGSKKITMSEEAGGLSIFIPRLVKSDVLPYFHDTQWYKAAGWNQTGW
jgi:hypothetical protein